MWSTGDRRNRGALPVNADVNLVNLVDVALTLLVIFIITAPMLQGGIDVELPQAETTPLTAGDEGVIVSIDADGTIYIGEVAVQSVEDFRTIFPQYVKEKEVRNVYLRGDRNVPYGRVAAVLGLMKELDVAEVGLVAIEPEPEE
ncbi:MAG TPA: biopolymer transporter ExbD [Longimicrobiales bacterium]